MPGWLYLFGAIILEVAGTTSMKVSDGFTRPLPSILIFLFYGLSFVALTFALKSIDLSIAYAIWSGLGMALIAAIGFAYFEEVLTPTRIAGLALIFLGVLALNLSVSES